MERWITATSAEHTDDRPVHINMARAGIMYREPKAYDTGATIVYVDGVKHTVRETPEELMPDVKASAFTGER